MTSAWHTTLFARLLAGVVGLVLLVMGPLAWFALRTQAATLEHAFQEELQVVTATLASALFDAAVARRQPTAQGILEQALSDSPVDTAFVVKADGLIWAHNDPAQVGNRFDGEAHKVRYLDWELPLVPGQEDSLGTVHAGILRSRVAGEVRESMTALGVIFAFVLLAAALLAIPLSSHMARPIRALTEAADAIASGDMRSPVPEVPGPAEVRRMAGAFERMRRSLNDHVQRLETSYAELDRKVHDLSVLYTVSEAMNAGDYSEGMLDTVAGAAAEGLEATMDALFLVASDGPELRLTASRGIDSRNAQERGRKLLEGAARLAVEQAANVQLEHPSPEEVPPTAHSSLRMSFGPPPRGEANVAAVPLIVSTAVVGALAAAKAVAFGREDMALLETLASHAARCVERAHLYTVSITDGLTGLFVSRYFRQRLNEELRTASRYQRPVSLCMLDIDHFKRVNDTWGHPAGDQVLKRVAGCLLEAGRADVDIAARYGGEEFALILPQTTLPGALVMAERLRALIEAQSVEIPGGTLHVTASLGVAAFPGHAKTAGDLLEAADKALYRAKAGGRNRVEAAG
jgi:diguanylate cyclase (GGDEF)-like protein